MTAKLSMRYSPFKLAIAGLAVIASVGLVRAQTQPAPQAKAQAATQAGAQAPKVYNGLGTVPTKDEMGNLAWASGFKGNDLPQGNGTAKQGADLFAGKCAMCHGSEAEGVHWEPGAFSPVHGPRLGGGNGIPTFVRPPDRITTIAYTAPSPMVIFDTIAVEMPMFKAGTLTPNQVFALTAFILYKNGIVKEEDVMDRETLPKVKMPRASTFPATDDVYMDMQKRGCYKTYGVCLRD